MFSFDFDALDEELDSAEPHQAEVASPWIIDGPEASRPVEDTAPYKALDSAEPHQAELAQSSSEHPANADLQDHVTRSGRRHHEKQADQRREEALPQPFILEQVEHPCQRRLNSMGVAPETASAYL